MADFNPAETLAGENLRAKYNDGVQTAANPGGFDGDGHLSNFIPSLRDVVTFGRGVARVAAETLTAINGTAARFEAAVAAIQAGPVTSVNGQSGAVVIELPSVLAPGNASPASGAVAVLAGGALTLSVVAFSSLYGGAAKSRQAQISTTAGFGTIVWDSGAVAGANLSVTLANAQATLTGGTTYYWRFRQTDETDFTSDWSAPTSFVFPRAPSAPAMTAPANGATGQGASNTAIQFAASDYAHPNGVAQASRVFEISATSTFAAIVATVPAAAGASTASLAAPKEVLQPDTLYYARCRDADVNGGSNTSAATTFRTVAQFKPNVGFPYEGGLLGPQFGAGYLYDLVLAAKSTEASRVWQASNVLIGWLSRLDGLLNTDGIISSTGGGSSQAAGYAKSIQIGGVAGYLAAIDEARAISFVLRPANAPAGSPFVSGGAEEFGTAHWSSTEVTAANALRSVMTTGQEIAETKSVSNFVRAIKRVAVTMPIAPGTYVAAQGGWAWFYFTDLSTGVPITCLMFKSDKSVEVTRAWSVSSSEIGTNKPSVRSRTNGQQATEDTAVFSGGNDLPAFRYCRELVHNGKDDWVLGGVDEYLTGARMNDQLPVEQRLAINAGTASYYWSSTEDGASLARQIGLDNGITEVSRAKTAVGYGVVPIRRVPITSL